ncbi:hypothetical protein [Pedobacter sp. L105]|uniref:hypothetical protein n=1 Tax=Pedobacter sp. L105 TaxID=1641871 RepID=UPI00131BDC52|nr:hypothetical protein [Pedobacter sp. L105]
MQKYTIKRLVSNYDEDAFDMVRNNELDLPEFLALMLYDDIHHKKICEKLTSYYKYEICNSIEDFTIPRAEYEGKNGLVKLEYDAFFKYHDKDSDDEFDEDETREETRYTNISFTIDTELKQIVFWFPLFS